MPKIKIENNQFTCPMLNLLITERGELNYGTCRICRNNMLRQIINDYVYCSFGMSSGGGNSGGGSGSTEDPWEDYTGWEDYDNDNNG